MNETDRNPDGRDTQAGEQNAGLNDPTLQTPASGPLTGFLIRVSIITAVVLILLLMLYAIDVLLLIFAGILVAIFLRGLSDFVCRKTDLPQNWSLTLVVITVLLTIAGFIWWLAPSVAEQFDELRSTIPESLEKGELWLSQYGWGQQLIKQVPTFEQAMPDGSDALSRITGIFSSTLSVFANLMITIVIGIYLAAGGNTYTNGIVRLFPVERRARAREVLDELGFTLWWWLLGRSAAVIIVGSVTSIGLYILDVPLALTLGLIAGLFDFIPNIGPFLAGIPGVLIALTVSPTTALYVLIFYLGVQVLVSYLLTPLLLKKTVELPPAITISAQVALGVLVGGLGLVLASPLAAAVFVLVRMLYLEDTLGDPVTMRSKKAEEKH